MKIFTDEGLQDGLRKVSLVLRREHNKNIAEIIEKAGLIDYNVILEERKRKKAEELTLKAQMMKEKGSATGKVMQNAVGSLFKKRTNQEE